MRNCVGGRTITNKERSLIAVYLLDVFWSTVTVTVKYSYYLILCGFVLSVCKLVEVEGSWYDSSDVFHGQPLQTFSREGVGATGL